MKNVVLSGPVLTYENEIEISKKEYYSIIEFSQQNIPEGYFEKHHIIPKSCGGSNLSSNLVKLTAQNHYRCHELLTKMYDFNSKERQKMIFALHKMSYGTNKLKYKLTPEKYESIRILNAFALSNSQKERFKDEKTKKQQAIYALNASKIAAIKNKDNPEFGQNISRVQQLLVEQGKHNFLGGEVQKTMWTKSGYREKQKLAMEHKISNNLHSFQNENFIAENKERLKNHWKNMTLEQKEERKNNIREGKKRKKLLRAFLNEDEQ